MKLELSKGKFYRIKPGQTRQAVEDELSAPANSVFAGAVIELPECTVHTVSPFETYGSIAKAYGVGEEYLKAFNGARLLYPTRKIFIPGKE